MPQAKQIKSAPEPDTDGLRVPFSALSEPVQPRIDENDRAYSAFLLWCLMAPADRSKRLLGKALGCSGGTIRYWHKRHSWERRLATGGADVEWDALKGYRLLMDLQSGAGQTAALHVALDVVLDRAGLAAVRHSVAAQRKGKEAGKVEPEPKNATEAQHSKNIKAFKTPLSDKELEEFNATKHLQSLRNQILKDHMRPDDLRRQVLLIDAVLGLIAKRVQDGSLQVKVSDIPQLLKARALITGLPTEQVAVAVQHDHRHDHSLVVESARMAQARKKGGTAVLAAMQEELTELNTIIGAIPRIEDSRDIIDITPEEE